MRRPSPRSQCPACGEPMPAATRRHGLRRLCCDPCWKKVPLQLRKANTEAARAFRHAAGDFSARRFLVGRVNATAIACLRELGVEIQAEAMTEAG